MFTILLCTRFIWALEVLFFFSIKINIISPKGFSWSIFFTLNLNITTEYNKLNVPKEDFYFYVKCKMVMIFLSVSCMFQHFDVQLSATTWSILVRWKCGSLWSLWMKCLKFLKWLDKKISVSTNPTDDTFSWYISHNYT